MQSLGIGIGLRVPHYAGIFDPRTSEASKPDFFEVISENFMVPGGPPIRTLDRVLDEYPVVQHGVSLSIASAEALDFDYLARLKALCEKTRTPWFSDHLSWTTCHGENYHDLLPVPYTEENVRYIAERARIVQDYVGIPFALENLSTYLAFEDSELSEAEFYRAVVLEAGVHMMLDVNNIYVSSVNHGFDARDYLDVLPMDRVLQVHVAGPSELPDGSLIDTHDSEVRDEAWELYRRVHARTGGVSTLLEWDAKFLSFEDTVKEARKAERYQVADART